MYLENLLFSKLGGNEMLAIIANGRDKKCPEV